MQTFTSEERKKKPKTYPKSHFNLKPIYQHEESRYRFNFQSTKQHKKAKIIESLSTV